MTSENEIHQCKCDICQAGSDSEIVQYHRQMSLFLGRLNEPQRRWYVGLLSQQPDSPSERQLSKIAGVSRKNYPTSDDKWLNYRLKDVQEQLDEQGHGVSLPLISRLLQQHDYSFN